jgi:hypothetical protein
MRAMATMAKKAFLPAGIGFVEENLLRWWLRSDLI